jgi:hypothetical protein
MQTRSIVGVVTVSLMIVAGCGDGMVGSSLCEQAADHLAQCTGQPAEAPASCDDAAAESVLGQSCEQLSGRDTFKSKSCPTGMACVSSRFLFWSDPCARCVDTKPRAAKNLAQASEACSTAGMWRCTAADAMKAGIKVSQQAKEEWLGRSPAAPNDKCATSINSEWESGLAWHYHQVACNEIFPFRCCASSR